MKVGIRRPGRVEIVEGLNEGDTVVIAGQQRIQKDGSALRILEVNRPRGEGAPGAPAAAMAAVSAAGPASAASAATGSAGGAQASVTPTPLVKPAAPAKALEGPNPCLVDLAGVAPRGDGGGKSGAEAPGRKDSARGAPAKS